MYSNSRNKKKQFNHDHHQPRHSSNSPANPFTLENGRARQLGYLVDVAQLNIPKVLVPPIEPQNVDLNSFCIELQNQFRDDLLGTTEKILAIKQKYTRQQVDYLNYLVIEYFDNLHTKLQLPDLEYDRIRLGQKGQVNYVFYGQRFWDWCVESQLFNDHTLRNYSILLFKLLRRCPRKMLKLHYWLCAALYLSKILKSTSQSKSEFDFKIATYEPDDDPWKIHNFIKRKGKCTFEDGSLYYKKTFPTFPLFKKFFLAELKRFLNFSDFPVELEFSDYRFQEKDGECFNWNITFKDDHYKELTFLILVILIAREHFAVHYGILFEIGLNSVTLRFDSSFYQGCEHIKFASFQIHGHISSEVYQLFEFLSKMGNFDVFMGHLFYWAHQNSLLDGTLFGIDLEFAFMILFYLEQQRPYSKVSFPTVRKLTEDYALFKRPEDLSQVWNDQHFLAKVNLDYFSGDARIENWMVFGFFEFYHNFDFSTYVICPYDGLGRDKKTYEQRNKCKLSRWICIEFVDPSMHPIPNERCTEVRMQQFKLLIERMYLVLKDRNQPEMFYIEALTNPEYFLNSENFSNESQVCVQGSEISDVSKGLFESNDHELVPVNQIESISDLVADLSVKEKIVQLNHNEEETYTENDLNESSTNESETKVDQPNTDQPFGNQTGSNEEDNSDDD